MKTLYCPKRGDIIRLSFDPTKGSELQKRRPALVLSPESYNQKVGLCLVCPITSHQKGYPFEVSLPLSCETKGVILSDHIKSLDWRARESFFVESLDAHSLQKVLEKILLILEIDL